MDKISFSFRTAFKESWKIFKKHAMYLAGVALVILVMKLAGGEKPKMIVAVVSGIVSLVAYITLLKSALAIVQNENQELSLKTLSSFFPSLREFLGVIVVGVAAAAVMLVGFALVLIMIFVPSISVVAAILAGLCVIVGIYIALRLLLSTYFFVEGKLSIREALAASWHATKNRSVANKTIIVLIGAGIFSSIGFAVFGVGALITYPMSLIIIAKYYYVAKRFGTTTVVPQPVEIPPVQA